MTPTTVRWDERNQNYAGMAVSFFPKLWSWVTRRKQIDWSMLDNTDLKRCLTTVDLTALGIGATLGAGAYVLAGQEAGAVSGPAVMLSFLIAAIASFLAGLCYAEFGARVPKAGSAYVYSYVTVGEIIAFFIGWNLLLEYVIGTASVASAWSGYLDSLLDQRISRGLNATVPMNIHGLGPYPDFVAFGITMLLTCVVAFGVGESAMVNNILTVVNLLVIAFVIVCGLFKANFHNWSLSQEEVNALKRTPDENVGKGGFFPWGVKGMLTSASSCFYGFVGFDAVATTAEEAKNPQRSIPLAITISLAFIFCAYFGISVVITLMTPYPLLNVPAPLPQSFVHAGWPFARYVISVGALAALTTSLFGGMFPMPRIVYAMGCDGLIFKGLARVNKRTKTPLIATFLTGLFTALFAMLFSLVDLINMMSIGTLLAYTLVAICVVILRYSPEEFPKRAPDAIKDVVVLDDSGQAHSTNNNNNGAVFGDQQRPASSVNDDSGSRRLSSLRGRQPSRSTDRKPSLLTAVVDPPPVEERATRSAEAAAEALMQRGPFYWRRVIPVGNIASIYRQAPSVHSSTIANWCVASYTVCCFLLSACVVFIHPLTNYAWIATGIFIATVIGSAAVVALQPQNPQRLAFRVPLAPYLPLLSVLINSYLMMALPVPTWIRFLVWLAIGMLLYVLYGIRHSRAPIRGVELQPLVEISNKEDTTTVDRVAAAMGTLNRGYTTGNVSYSNGGDEIDKSHVMQESKPDGDFIVEQNSTPDTKLTHRGQHENPGEKGSFVNEAFRLSERESK